MKNQIENNTIKLRIDSMSVIDIQSLFLLFDIYLCTKVELEAQENTKRNTNNIITSDIDICYKCLPPTTNSHTYNYRIPEFKPRFYYILVRSDTGTLCICSALITG